MTLSRLTTGDLAQTAMLRLGQGRLKADLARLSTELTTGQRQEAHPRLGGDLTPLMGLQRSRQALTPWQGAASEAATAHDAGQNALAALSDISTSMAHRAFDVAGLGTDSDIARTAEQAREDFARLTAALNTPAGGRALFAGTATDGAATVDGATMLQQIADAATAAGAISAGDVMDVIDAYFAPGGGYDTAGYLGADAAAATGIGPRDSVPGLPTAADSRVRDVLRAAAVGALAADDGLQLSATDRRLMVETTATHLLAAEAGLTDLRATVGRGQEAIEEGLTRLSSEAAALDLAIADLVAADPFETAARLEATSVQLETLYAVTARLSNMGLAGYLS